MQAGGGPPSHRQEGSVDWDPPGDHGTLHGHGPGVYRGANENTGSQARVMPAGGIMWPGNIQRYFSEKCSKWPPVSDNVTSSLEIRLEAEAGIEPANGSFANFCLTTWLLRRFGAALIASGAGCVNGWRGNLSCRGGEE